MSQGSNVHVHTSPGREPAHYVDNKLKQEQQIQMLCPDLNRANMKIINKT